MKIKEFIAKLQNLPDNKKTIVLWTIVAVLAIIMGYFWVNSAIKNLSEMGESIGQIQLPEIETPKTEGIILKDETSDWKTYKNDEYGFEIKYPLDWTFRQYISGAAFFPKDKSSENITGNGAVNVGFYERGANYCKIPFADYVKIAGPSEIQNYESLNAIESGINSNGSEMYKITWNYIDFDGNEKVSLPITYFGTADGQLCGSIDAFLNDNNFLDIYNKMILTFKFAE